MMLSSLYLPHTPMMGVSGQRDNVAVLLQVMGCLLSPGTVLDVRIDHDSVCPCAGGTAALEYCLCEHVNLTIQVVKSPTKEAGRGH